MFIIVIYLYFFLLYHTKLYYGWDINTNKYLNLMKKKVKNYYYSSSFFDKKTLERIKYYKWYNNITFRLFK